MSKEKEGMMISINTKECKTEFSQEFNDCKTVPKNSSLSENIDSAEVSGSLEAIKMNFQFKLITILVLLFSLVVGITVVIIAGKVSKQMSYDCLKMCMSVIGFIALFFIATVVSLDACIRIIKPFIKMGFLKSLLENPPKDRELIKKYCDTLVEL